jgi:hypothetical protein
MAEASEQRPENGGVVNLAQERELPNERPALMTRPGLEVASGGHGAAQ